MHNREVNSFVAAAL